jgi:hypothetical protein
MTMGHDVFGTREQTTLPSPDFTPTLVIVRRCEDCSALDRRLWYASFDAAERDSWRLPLWNCPSCGGARAQLFRGWFAAIYEA